ncbi:MAG: type I pullulanase [Saprospiraceae bacterium]|nr:MAG: type I pullulanase [Saprospiraceae bacterium]
MFLNLRRKIYHMKYPNPYFILLTLLMAAPLYLAGQTDSMSSDAKSKYMRPNDQIITDDMLNAYPAYNGSDLGLTYSNKKSTFKIWSPTAKEARLFLYDKGWGGDTLLIKNMKKGKRGTWSTDLSGDQEGQFYAFQVLVDTTWLAETPDPYAVAAGVNGHRAMVVDLAKTNPEGWDHDQRPPLNSISEIVLYELHLRDISMHPSSGIQHKGKYLGLAETGTHTKSGTMTGLDHIKDLGVTHVHLLPVFDYASVDESALQVPQYNWGYDPQNYNIPEGSYATDPFDGRVRIREFKQMVKSLHENGLRVVMDVVYNHTSSTEGSVFNNLVPKYYYRLNDHGGYSNASGCGNETASERPMMRKFMLESMLYWVKEYHVDGFRVDLMGIHDIKTMNLIADELHKIDPTIFIYGEGWTAGDSPYDAQERAVKTNTWKLHGTAVFCDEFRDGVKGNVFAKNAKGFASGETGLQESVKFGIVGAVAHPQVDNKKVNYSQYPWSNTPLQCINYVSCHDNHTLYDRLRNSCQGEPDEELVKIIKIAQTLVFTSQGIPFLLAGEEFTRTKFGVENSFEAGDEINQIDWKRKEQFGELNEYFKALIQLRKHHPAFRMAKKEDVQAHLKFLDIPNDNILGYEITDHANGDSWKRILLIFNTNKTGKQVTIPEGDWTLIAVNGRIDESGLGNITGPKANLQPRSVLILAEEN